VSERNEAEMRAEVGDDQVYKESREGRRKCKSDSITTGQIYIMDIHEFQLLYIPAFGRLA
jgi:hypothetical protein